MSGEVEVRLAVECCWCIPPIMNAAEICQKCGTQWRYADEKKTEKPLKSQHQIADE